jgi:hypothetical protein
MLAHLSSEIVRASPTGRVFAHDFPQVAVNQLKTLHQGVEVQRGHMLTEQQADGLIAQAKLIISCV